jgi:hypothetical protein
MSHPELWGWLMFLLALKCKQVRYFGQFYNH